jgi:exodeoxyribonuclease-1
MGYVIYDVETTGLRRGFDQILQFAAVLTDETLTVLDRFEARCRLSPHILPAPQALQVTQADIRDLVREDLPSHYAMVCGIHERLRAWGPAIYLGFNSIRFDEEFLRQAFYQCLLPVYLTNTGGSTRADVLTLARTATALRPDVLSPHRDPDGRAAFRLADLARANGIAAPNAHVASGDVDITLALCRRLVTGAPDLWSRFVQFSQKSVAAAFLQDENAFLMYQGFGDYGRPRLLTRIGQHDGQANRQYCLDLTADPDHLEELDDDALTALFRERDGPLVVVKTNAAPLLYPIYDLPDGHFIGLPVERADQHVDALRDRPNFMRRMAAAARRAEREYPPSPHVEHKLYGHPFPCAGDEELMRTFHKQTWPERAKVAGQFQDPRYRLLARRLVYFERPDLLPPQIQMRFAEALYQRLTTTDPDCPWLTLPAAKAQLDALDGASGDERCSAYAAYLNERTELSAAQS